jgi:trehalose synthase
MFEVEVSRTSPERFRAILAPERYEQFERGMQHGRELLAGRVVWNINSTARGGAVSRSCWSRSFHTPAGPGLTRAGW